ncbi:MAG: hypothetical protein JNK49_03975, partial [Planctomycetes bacterium]|nr:hypothetical protein [Planctomycetota bacterium]
MMNVYTTAEDRARRRRLVITALTLMAIVIAIVMTIGLAWSPMGSSDSGPTEWSSSGTLPAAAVTGAPEDRARVDSFAERTSTAAGRSDHTNVHEPLIHGVVCNPSGRPVAG